MPTNNKTDFREFVIPTSILDDAIAWIRAELPPGDVYSVEQLEDWALENNFMRLHPMEEEV